MEQQISSTHWTLEQISPRTTLQPAECARRLLRELNVQSLPIQPQEIAVQLQIIVWEREIESQHDGCLMKVGNTWGILLNNQIQSQPRKNFTIGHELGHYYLDPGHTLQHRCRREDLRVFGPHQLEEQRANQFAVELLMPYPIFQADAADLPEVGLHAIDPLAAKYSTSLTSTAIHYTRLSQHVCAIAFSENRKIKYFAYSEGFRQNCECYLAKNKPLHPTFFAHPLATSRFKEVKEKQGEVPLSYGCSTKSDRTIIEQSRCLPRMNQVLSFLWLLET